MKTLMMTLLLMSSFVKAEVVFDTLYVNSGCFISETDSFPYISFNKDSLFSTENSIISKSPYDTLILYLINNDSVDHSFEIANSLLKNTDDHPVFTAFRRCVCVSYKGKNQKGAELGCPSSRNLRMVRRNQVVREANHETK